MDSALSVRVFGIYRIFQFLVSVLYRKAMQLRQRIKIAVVKKVN